MNRYFAGNWYLWIFSPTLSPEKIAVIDLQDDDQARVDQIPPETEFAVFIVGEKCLSIMDMIETVLTASKAIRNVHVIVRAEERRDNQLQRIIQIRKFRRELSRATGGDIKFFGLLGNWHSPQLVLPLQRHIFRYVATVAFRGSDSPCKSFFKGCLATVLGPWGWNGSLILACELSLPGPDTGDDKA